MINPKSILDIKLDVDLLQETQFPVETIRDYFKRLLLTMWDEKERFSGKRPFGNSDWEYDLYLPLIREGIVEGELDEYNDIIEFDQEQADQLIKAAIYSLFW